MAGILHVDLDALPQHHNLLPVDGTVHCAIGDHTQHQSKQQHEQAPMPLQLHSEQQASPAPGLPAQTPEAGDSMTSTGLDPGSAAGLATPAMACDPSSCQQQHLSPQHKQQHTCFANQQDSQLICAVLAAGAAVGAAGQLESPMLSLEQLSSGDMSRTSSGPAPAPGSAAAAAASPASKKKGSTYGSKRASALKRQGHSNVVPGPEGTGRSNFRGVFWDRKNSRWRAQVGHNNRKIFMGYFADPADAAKAYDKKLVQLHGTMAKTNFPLEEYAEDLKLHRELRAREGGDELLLLPLEELQAHLQQHLQELLPKQPSLHKAFSWAWKTAQQLPQEQQQQQTPQLAQLQSGQGDLTLQQQLQQPRWQASNSSSSGGTKGSAGAAVAAELPLDEHPPSNRSPILQLDAAISQAADRYGASDPQHIGQIELLTKGPAVPRLSSRTWAASQLQQQWQQQQQWLEQQQQWLGQQHLQQQQQQQQVSVGMPTRRDVDTQQPWVPHNSSWLLEGQQQQQQQQQLLQVSYRSSPAAFAAAGASDSWGNSHSSSSSSGAASQGGRDAAAHCSKQQRPAPRSLQQHLLTKLHHQKCQRSNSGQGGMEALLAVAARAAEAEEAAAEAAAHEQQQQQQQQKEQATLPVCPSQMAPPAAATAAAGDRSLVGGKMALSTRTNSLGYAASRSAAASRVPIGGLVVTDTSAVVAAILTSPTGMAQPSQQQQQQRQPLSTEPGRSAAVTAAVNRGTTRAASSALTAAGEDMLLRGLQPSLTEEQHTLAVAAKHMTKPGPAAAAGTVPPADTHCNPAADITGKGVGEGLQQQSALPCTPDVEAAGPSPASASAVAAPHHARCLADGAAGPAAAAVTATTAAAAGEVQMSPIEALHRHLMQPPTTELHFAETLDLADKAGLNREAQQLLLLVMYQQLLELQRQPQQQQQLLLLQESQQQQQQHVVAGDVSALLELQRQPQQQQQLLLLQESQQQQQQQAPLQQPQQQLDQQQESQPLLLNGMKVPCHRLAKQQLQQKPVAAYAMCVDDFDMRASQTNSSTLQAAHKHLQQQEEEEEEEEQEQRQQHGRDSPAAASEPPCKRQRYSSRGSLNSIDQASTELKEALPGPLVTAGSGTTATTAAEQCCLPGQVEKADQLPRLASLMRRHSSHSSSATAACGLVGDR